MKHEAKENVLDSKATKESKSWVGLIDPVGNRVTRAVILKDPRFATYTYDIKSVENAFKLGELKPFGIQTETQLRNIMIPRHLVNALIEFIKNEGNTTEVKDSMLDSIYESPPDYAFPQETPIYLCAADGHSYCGETLKWIFKTGIAPGSNVAIGDAHEEDQIAEWLVNLYSKIGPRKSQISQKEFYKILIKEFKSWREPETKDFYFCPTPQNFYIDKIVYPLLLAALIIINHSKPLLTRDPGINDPLQNLLAGLVLMIKDIMIGEHCLQSIRTGRLANKFKPFGEILFKFWILITLQNIFKGGWFAISSLAFLPVYRVVFTLLRNVNIYSDVNARE